MSGERRAGGLDAAPGAGAAERPARGTPRSRAFLGGRWDLVLFGLGLLALAFAYGVAVGKYRLFPHTAIDRAAVDGSWRCRVEPGP